jgi:hypothetical protein
MGRLMENSIDRGCFRYRARFVSILLVRRDGVCNDLAVEVRGRW